MNKTIAESPGTGQTGVRDDVERTLLSAAVAVEVGVRSHLGSRNKNKNKNKSKGSGQERPLHICVFG
jgi:hypothetical protein